MSEQPTSSSRDSWHPAPPLDEIIFDVNAIKDDQEQTGYNNQAGYGYWELYLADCGVAVRVLTGSEVRRPELSNFFPQAWSTQRSAIALCRLDLFTNP